jgi:H+/Cl- antiporter ClcA
VLSLLVAVSAIPTGRYSAIHNAPECNRGTPLDAWAVPLLGIVFGTATYLFLHAVGVPHRYRKWVALTVGVLAVLAVLVLRFFWAAAACAS